MEIRHFIPGLICIALALVILFRLMHYAHFYAPSYFFWIGAILLVVGVISLILPMKFLFISNRTIAAVVVLCGLLISVSSLFWPVKLKQSPTFDQKLDDLMPAYSFNEFHEVRINTAPDKVKEVFRVTGVKDIPIVRLLMKIRGIADDDVDMSDRASSNKAGADTFTTPDFNFFVLAPNEFISVMILKPNMISSDKEKPAPPEISSPEQFSAFNEPGYMKVAINFRFISTDNKETLLTTETRVDGTTKTDSSVFGRYWRIIYPGSAIIRRVWLDTIKKKAENNNKIF